MTQELFVKPYIYRFIKRYFGETEEIHLESSSVLLHKRHNDSSRSIRQTAHRLWVQSSSYLPLCTLQRFFQKLFDSVFYSYVLSNRNTGKKLIQIVQGFMNDYCLSEDDIAQDSLCKKVQRYEKQASLEVSSDVSICDGSGDGLAISPVSAPTEASPCSHVCDATDAPTGSRPEHSELCSLEIVSLIDLFRNNHHLNLVQTLYHLWKMFTHSNTHPTIDSLYDDA